MDIFRLRAALLCLGAFSSGLALWIVSEGYGETNARIVALLLLGVFGARLLGWYALAIFSFNRGDMRIGHAVTRSQKRLHVRPVVYWTVDLVTTLPAAVVILRGMRIMYDLDRLDGLTIFALFTASVAALFCGDTVADVLVDRLLLRRKE